MTAAWSALMLYFFALGDPIGMFHGLLGRVRHERLCERAGEEMVEVLRGKRRNSGKQIDAELAKSLSDSFGTLLSAMSDIIQDAESAKGALRHVLSQPSQLSDEDQNKSFLETAGAVCSLHTRGAPAAWIAVAVCIFDLLFLIIGPLQQHSSEPPSGAKIASAAAFSWLLPMVLLHAYYGMRADSRRAGQVIHALLETLSDQHLEGTRDAGNGEGARPVETGVGIRKSDA